MRISTADVLAMAEAARWAPSVHNTQPWRFRLRPDGLDVLVDPGRGLPELDPAGRLRTVSCGAAAAAAAVAATARGLGTQVRLLPHGPRAEVVARVAAVAPRAPTAGEQRLAEAVPRRRTHRALQPHETVPDDLLGDLVATVADEGARLTVLAPTERDLLTGLMQRALHHQHRHPEVMAETQRWLRDPGPPHGPRPVDGLLRGSLGTWPFPVGAAVREQPSPVELDLRLEQEVLDTTVVVLSTPTDTRRDHLVAGGALERLMLHATALDLAVGFADVATQVASTRPDVGGLLGRRGVAQVVLRLGRALVDVRVPPRRPLVDLLDASGAPDVVDLTSLHDRSHERTPR